MVQGIAFLSKKSWHTKNLNNQEKVWIAEQRKAAEETKTKELARQIQLEREREELDRLAGKKSHLDRGIDWMYQGQAAGGDAKPSELEQQDAENKAEEFLLGKEYVAEGAAKGDFAEASGAAEGVNAVVKLEDPNVAAAAAGGPGEDSVAERNEAFRQRVEDPMFMVGQKEREKRIEAGKQKALYERVMGPVDDDDQEEDDSDGGKKKKVSSKHERKRERKERRRREKEDRKRKRRDEEDRSERKKHRRRDDSDEESEDRRDRRHSRRKYYSSEEDSDREHRRHRHRGSRRRRSRSRSRDEEDRTHSRSSRRYRSRSRSRSPEESESSRHRHRSNHHSRDRPGGRDHHHHHHGRDRYSGRDERQRHHHDRDESRRSSHDYRREEPRKMPAKKEGYGLQGKPASSGSHSPKDLGPAQDLLRQKRQTVEEERRRARDRAGSRKTMTAEERAQALKEMQATAQARGTRDTRRPASLDDEDHKANRGNARFIKDMTEQAHGIKGSGSQSLASRMQQNRNTQQRLHDSSFL